MQNTLITIWVVGIVMATIALAVYVATHIKLLPRALAMMPISFLAALLWPLLLPLGLIAGVVLGVKQNRKEKQDAIAGEIARQEIMNRYPQFSDDQ